MRKFRELNDAEIEFICEMNKKFNSPRKIYNEYVDSLRADVKGTKQKMNAIQSKLSNNLFCMDDTMRQMTIELKLAKTSLKICETSKDSEYFQAKIVSLEEGINRYNGIRNKFLTYISFLNALKDDLK